MTLVVTTGDSIASFSDDTSTDSRRTREQVSIYAQVSRDASLDWYMVLRSQYPEIPGEIKGKRVVAEFENFPSSLRESVLKGIRNVRIHIADPTPARARIHRIRERVAGSKIPSSKELRHRASNGDRIARYLLETEEQYVARSLLIGSPYKRLRRQVLYGRLMPSAAASSDYEDAWIEKDIKVLQTSGKSLSARATEYTAKMGPVLLAAEEDAHRRRIEILPFRTYGPLFPQAVSQALRQTHAYDQGDEKLHNLLSMRLRRLAALADGASFDRGTDGGGGIAVETFVSADSVFGQASDVAGRVAAVFYERGGLLEVVRRFDKVSFNGNRVGEAEALDLLRRWPRLRPGGH